MDFRHKHLSLNFLRPFLYTPVVFLVTSFIYAGASLSPADKSWLPLIRVIASIICSAFVAPIASLMHVLISLFRHKFVEVDTWKRLRDLVPLGFVLTASVIAWLFFPNKTIQAALELWETLVAP